MSCSRTIGRVGCVLAGLLAIVGCASDAPDADTNGSLGAQVKGAMSELIIDGEFELQPYELPDGQGYRHIATAINEAKEELIIYGGLGSCFGPACPVNDTVYTLDLSEPPLEQDWQPRSVDDVVSRPWFTSTRGFVEFDDEYYLACDDQNIDIVYGFDPDTYQFQAASTSPLGLEHQSGDCCAVGVTIPNSRDGHVVHEDRIYILGGRNEFGTPDQEDPVTDVRYYSVTFDEWKQVEDLNVARSHLGCVAAERRGVSLIYAIGGGNSPAGEVLRSIEIYDVSKDKWTLHDDYFPEGQGRQRLGVQNLDNKYLMLIGGDSTCAGGGGANCEPDQPLTWVDLIDIKKNNRLISDDSLIPQLQIPRQTPGTMLIRLNGHGPKYSLFVVGGRTRDSEGLGALTTTEVLSFHRIEVQNLH